MIIVEMIKIIKFIMITIVVIKHRYNNDDKINHYDQVFQ